MPRLHRLLKDAAFEIAPLQAAWVREAVPLPIDELTNDIRLILHDGTLVSGADVYIYCLKQIRLTRPLGILLGLPGLRWVTRSVYVLVNRNRFVISKICKLPAEFFF